MRHSFVFLIGFLTACSGSTTRSLTPVESAALLTTSVPVTLVTTNTQKAPTPPSIASVQDSIVLRETEAPVCGGSHANAATSGDTVIVTLTVTRTIPQTCMLVTGNLIYTATVTGVAAGAHDVIFTEDRIAGSDTTRSVLATGRVVLP
jgi:hypothetical protein